MLERAVRETPNATIENGSYFENTVAPIENPAAIVVQDGYTELDLERIEDMAGFVGEIAPVEAGMDAKKTEALAATTVAELKVVVGDIADSLKIIAAQLGLVGMKLGYAPMEESTITTLNTTINTVNSMIEQLKANHYLR